MIDPVTGSIAIATVSALHLFRGLKNDRSKTDQVSKDLERTHERRVHELRLASDLRLEEIEVQIRADHTARRAARREDLDLALSPFDRHDDSIRALAEAVAGRPARPLLMISPFRRDDVPKHEADAAGQPMLAAIHDVWHSRNSTLDLLAPFTGYLKHSLNFDADLQRISSVLDGLPFVIVGGSTRYRTYLDCVVIATGLPLTGHDGEIRIKLPRLRISSNESEIEARIAAEDAAAAAIAMLLELLAETAACATQGRPLSLVSWFRPAVGVPNDLASLSRAAALDIAEVALQAGVGVGSISPYSAFENGLELALAAQVPDLHRRVQSTVKVLAGSEFGEGGLPGAARLMSMPEGSPSRIAALQGIVSRFQNDPEYLTIIEVCHQILKREILAEQGADR